MFINLFIYLLHSQELNIIIDLFCFLFPNIVLLSVPFVSDWQIGWPLSITSFSLRKVYRGTCFDADMVNGWPNSHDLILDVFVLRLILLENLMESLIIFQMFLMTVCIARYFLLI